MLNVKVMKQISQSNPGNFGLVKLSQSGSVKVGQADFIYVESQSLLRKLLCSNELRING